MLLLLNYPCYIMKCIESNHGHITTAIWGHITMAIWGHVTMAM